jgi:hypothetical protein
MKRVRLLGDRQAVLEDAAPLQPAPGEVLI